MRDIEKIYLFFDRRNYCEGLCVNKLNTVFTNWL